MKIILVGPVYPYRGGIAHHTLFLDAALQQLGCQTQMISFARQYPAWLYPGKTDKDPSQKALPPNAIYLLDPLNPGSWIRTAQTILKAAPDRVIFQWWTTFWSIPFAFLTRYLKRHGIPVIYIIHNVIPHEPRFFDRPLARLALSTASALLAQTAQEKARLLNLVPGAKVQTCHMPMFPIQANHIPDRETAKNHLGIPSNQVCLLFFGFVRPYKGLRFLIEALGILKQNNLTPHLIIAGEFWQDKSLYLRQIENLQLSHHIHIFDHYIPDKEVPWYFAAADIFVAPYIQGTTQSASAALARSFRLPMIITDQVKPGLDESDKNLLQVVPSANANALAQALQTAINQLAFPSHPDIPLIPAQMNPKQAEEEWKRFALTIIDLA